MAWTEYGHAHYPKAVARSLLRDWVQTEYAHWEKGPFLEDAGAPESWASRVLLEVLQALHGDHKRMPVHTVAKLFTLYDMVSEDGRPEVTAEEFQEWRSRNRSYSYHNGARTVRAFLHHMGTMRTACQESVTDPPQLRQLFSSHCGNKAWRVWEQAAVLLGIGLVVGGWSEHESNVANQYGRASRKAGGGGSCRTVHHVRADRLCETGLKRAQACRRRASNGFCAVLRQTWIVWKSGGTSMIGWRLFFLPPPHVYRSQGARRGEAIRLRGD